MTSLLPASGEATSTARPFSPAREKVAEGRMRGPRFGRSWVLARQPSLHYAIAQNTKFQSRILITDSRFTKINQATALRQPKKTTNSD